MTVSDKPAPTVVISDPTVVRHVIEAVQAAVNGATKSAPRKRPRKPRIDKMIAEAETAGRSVSSITTPEGYTLTFGKPEGADVRNENPWDEVLKHERH